MAPNADAPWPLPGHPPPCSASFRLPASARLHGSRGPGHHLDCRRNEQRRRQHYGCGHLCKVLRAKRHCSFSFCGHRSAGRYEQQQHQAHRPDDLGGDPLRWQSRRSLRCALVSLATSSRLALSRATRPLWLPRPLAAPSPSLRAPSLSSPATPAPSRWPTCNCLIGLCVRYVSRACRQRPAIRRRWHGCEIQHTIGLVLRK
jgi:hypothetical protein